MTKEDAINIFKESFCGFEAYCEIHQDGLCLTDNCEIWWAIKALEQCKADIVDVVRCADCTHSYETFAGLICSHGVCVDCIVRDDFYCSYGERK